MFKRLAASLLCLAIATLAVPRSARADELGFKIGPGRLHAFFDVEGRYDTAAEATTNTAGNAQFEPDFYWRFRPGLKLEIPSDIVAVSLTAAVEYLYYMGLNDSSASKELSRFQGEGTLGINILQGQTVGVNLGDHLTRSNQTTNPGLPYGVLSLYNDASVAVPIIPGQGSLTITPSYHLMTEDYSPLLNIAEPSTFNPATLNYLTQQIMLQNRWRFLPKTAILLDGEYDFRSYTTGGSGNVAEQYLVVSTGIAGLLTPHIATIARIGYGQTIGNGSISGIDGLIGQLEGSYLPNEVTSIRLGVSRTFAPVTAPYSSYVDSRPYLGASTLLFGRLVLRGLVSLDYIQYEGFNGSAALAASQGTTSRADTVIMVDVGADFAALQWLTISLGDTFTDRSSTVSNTPANFGTTFNDEQVYLRVSFHY